MGLVADGAAMREDDEMRRGSFGARGSGSDRGGEGLRLRADGGSEGR
jgi:hypothetical protein